VDFISSLSASEIAENQHTFVENPAFRGILQDVVRQNIALEEMVRNEAAGLQAGEGWIHFCDLRQLPAYVPLRLPCKLVQNSSRYWGILWGLVLTFFGRFGRIPEVEDIIGSVLVKDGKILPETYEGLSTYRLVTTAGPMKLSEFMLGKLREKLKLF